MINFYLKLHFVKRSFSKYRLCCFPSATSEMHPWDLSIDEKTCLPTRQNLGYGPPKKNFFFVNQRAK